MEQHLLTLLAGAVCLSVAASSSTRPSDATTAWLEQHEHELGSAAAAAALAKPHFHTCPQVRALLHRSAAGAAAGGAAGAAAAAAGAAAAAAFGDVGAEKKV